MRSLDRRLAAALAFAGVLACSGEKPAAPAPASHGEPAASATPAPAPQPAPAAAATEPERPATAAAKPKPEPAPAAKPAPDPAAPSGAGPKPPAAPAAGAHAKVGPDKCRMCHRVQHQSWAESAHAKKGLDCEGCHGNGGDYWPASVMRDRAKAAAAGLVQPGVDRCRPCHAKPDASLLPKAHAHK